MKPTKMDNQIKKAAKALLEAGDKEIKKHTKDKKSTEGVNTKRKK
jgi:hypothetical protein